MPHPSLVRTTIEKLVFGGQGLGHAADGRVVFAWNALPGEVVDVTVTKRKKNFYEGVATAIIQAVPERQAVLEEHYLSCSPWQIMNFASEQRWKQQLATEAYKSLGRITVSDLPIYTDEHMVGYRNKMEFSFYEHDQGGISLAWFQRGQHRRYPITDCVLADPAIMKTAQAVLAWVNQLQLTRHQLKSLIVRSNDRGETIWALFVKDHVQCQPVPDLPDCVIGWRVYYSQPRSPAALPTTLLASSGSQNITSTIRHTSLRYGALSFFQVNVPVFQQALADISQWLDPNASLLDYYAGVGAISLSLPDYYQTAVLIENNAEAVHYAQANILANGFHHCQAVLSSAEAMTNAIEPDHTLIVDPPRAGLHPDMITTCLTVQPRRIIYLSCNVSTQARDLALLCQRYNIRHQSLYNFFPRTPHIEALCVLDRSTLI